jgi:hypothetical protein
MELLVKLRLEMISIYIAFNEVTIERLDAVLKDVE